MVENIIIAGAGGQGIMLLGKILTEAAALENKFVTWLPAYGAEVRGGAAYCMVIISSQEIGSPFIDKADTLIIMNSPSLDKFKNRRTVTGLVIINSSLVKVNEQKNKDAICHPFTDIATKLGNLQVANMVALGCLVAKKKIVQAESLLKAIRKIAPADKKDLIEVNIQAVKKGLSLK